MRNKSVSDFVAASMDAVLKSQDHQSLFGGVYKFASEQCEKCNCAKEDCKCDAAMAWDSLEADDNSAKSSDSDLEDSSESDSNDVSDASSDEDKESVAFDVAIDSLLTASAALDSVGLERGSSLSLKLASLVVEAKKKEDKKKSDSKIKSTDSNDARAKKKKEEDKKKSDAAKKKSTDSNDARSKKKPASSSSSSSSSKKPSSSSSSSKKPNPFAKKK